MTKETSQSELSLREAGEKFIVFISVRELHVMTQILDVMLGPYEGSGSEIEKLVYEAQELRDRLKREEEPFKWMYERR